ncbi:DUF7544 domain-containing protein [Natrialba swarupiae]|uniref:Glycerophosphoryl diester phosphodiesterase membrane domain-containing protein n=1 Tax=Natrialba swarupiae TaxID=2448032 RepID=A0A5D5AUD4_9EURY|nr:hypothetical protein [Natrialba swarupiae]TYT63452.1 hypothetical protein FYC77_02435 [Natrialba swarupiae]
MDAVDNLSDAIDATRNLLLPIRAWLWLKLAIVVFFLGGTGGGFSTGDPTIATDDEMISMVQDTVTEEILIGFAIVAAVVLVIWLLFEALGAIAEFVFIEGLRSKEVSIISYALDNIGRAVRLFVFRVGLGLLVWAIVLVPAGLLLYSAGWDVEAAFDVGTILLLLGVGALSYLVFAIVMRFTSEFVAPIMLLESRGVLSGWKRFWGTLTAKPSEYVVYLLLVWILQLVIGIAVGFLMLFVTIIVAIPFVILVVALLALGDIGVWLAIIAGIIGVLLFFVISAFISMPIRTYFQYYALLLLGDTNDELDLIPDQRAEIRSDGGRDEPGSPAGRELRDGTDDDDWDADTDDRNDDWDADTDTREDSSDWDDSTPWDDDSSDWDEPDDGEDDRDDRGW